MDQSRPYHHGGLRRAVLDAAVEAIREQGPASLSLRDLARRAGVSHAAPAHHFGDKAGLLTALAAEGHELLGDALADAPDELAELGVRYVRFALEHPAHFEVMHRPDLVHDDDPALVAAREHSFTRLRARVAAQADPGLDPAIVRVAAWSLAHGFAALWSAGALERPLAGRDDPYAAFREVAALLGPGRSAG